MPSRRIDVCQNKFLGPFLPSLSPFLCFLGRVDVLNHFEPALSGAHSGRIFLGGILRFEKLGLTLYWWRDARDTIEAAHSMLTANVGPRVSAELRLPSIDRSLTSDATNKTVSRYCMFCRVEYQPLKPQVCRVHFRALRGGRWTCCKDENHRSAGCLQLPHFYIEITVDKKVLLTDGARYMDITWQKSVNVIGWTTNSVTEFPVNMLHNKISEKQYCSNCRCSFGAKTNRFTYYIEDVARPAQKILIRQFAIARPKFPSGGIRTLDHCIVSRAL